MNRGIRRRLHLLVTPDLIARFWAKVDRRDAGECWPWMATTRESYGAIKHRGKVFSAHCVAWILANARQIPKGQIVRHSCDNPQCCNPAHLLLGTPADNVRDMHERGLARYARGAQCYNAVLTEELVRTIRSIREAERIGYRAIARRLGIPEHEQAVKGVVENKSWKHVISSLCEQ